MNAKNASFISILCGCAVGCRQAPLWPATAPLTRHELTEVLTEPLGSNIVEWFNVALAGQPTAVQSNAWYRLTVAVDAAAVVKCAELMGEAELARRLDTHKRGTSRSGWTSNQLWRAYELRAQRTKVRGTLRKSRRDLDGVRY